MTDNSDPLLNFLKSDPPCSPAWKDSLLAQTTSVLRWRRRGRRLGIVAGLAACYVAGVLTMRMIQPVPVVQTITEYVYVAPESKMEKQTEPEKPVTALALEWQAVDNPERSVELYLRAGNQYMDQENDLDSALRCYKRYLTECDESELKPRDADNWLLKTLKNARLEGKNHARNG